jgi:HPt (histidine-containing phosphotransfer) domain-containing protein
MHQDSTAKPHGEATPVVPLSPGGGKETGLDRSAFDDLVAEIGREDTLETFAIFFKEADNRVKRLRELSCEEDRKALEHEAHGLKGSAANFGLRQVSELAEKLERDARVIAAVDYEATMRSLEMSYIAAREHFATLAA